MSYISSPKTKAHRTAPASPISAKASPGTDFAQRAASSPATARLGALQRKADSATTGKLSMGPMRTVAAPAIVHGPVLQGAFDVAYQGSVTARSKDNPNIPPVHMWHPKWTEERADYPNPKDNPEFDAEAYEAKGRKAQRTYNRLMRGTTRDMTVALWSVKARSLAGKNHVVYLQDRTPGQGPYTYYNNAKNNPTQDDHIKGMMNATDQGRFDQWNAAR